MAWYEEKQYKTIVYEEIPDYSNQWLTPDKLIKMVEEANQKAIDDNADKIWVDIDIKYDEYDKEIQGVVRIKGHRLETNKECEERQKSELTRRKRQYEQDMNRYKYWMSEKGREEIKKFG